MNEKHVKKLIPHAQRIFDLAVQELDKFSFTNKEKYNILRYLTNMLESEEAELYKKIK